MRSVYRLLLVLCLGGQLAACEKVRAVVCEPVKASAKTPTTANKKQEDAGVATEQATPSKESGEPALAEDDQAVAQGDKPDKERVPGGQVLTSHQHARQGAFALPFAWEKSPDEPLAKARTFLREVADDNTAYMTKGPAFFQAFANAQTPRATVLTCADSRVQAGAFDASPENDVFTIRNIGNQVDNGLGSIEYGIEHLHTPVLLIVGHTGCGAVKAALGDTRELSEPIRRELSTLHLGKSGKGGAIDDAKWREAVLENVHDQVRAALHQFAQEVNTGSLTIVGAVYDFRNELGHGAGKLSVIDVNGVQEAGRLKAFGEAIMTGPGKHAAAAEDPMLRLVRALADQGAFEEPGAEAEHEQ